MAQVSRQLPSRRPLPHLRPFFPDGIPSEMILREGLQDIPLRFPFSIWFCETSFRQGSPRNRAVDCLCPIPLRRPWYGPVIVLKYSGTTCTMFADISPLDRATLVAYFMQLV